MRCLRDSARNHAEWPLHPRATRASGGRSVAAASLSSLLVAMRRGCWVSCYSAVEAVKASLSVRTRGSGYVIEAETDLGWTWLRQV